MSGDINQDNIVSPSIETKIESEYAVIQTNGCRVYGPPKNFSGTPPGTNCEVFVKRIPRNLFEDNLLPHFERFGAIYEFRLMMDYSNMNRGYAYVRYLTEESATVALEVMNHYIIQPGKNLIVQRSYDKCRLFVGNLPKYMDKVEIEKTFKDVFPEMQRFVMHNRISDGHKNRGFAFIDFSNHKAALSAKKKYSPGILRLWNRLIKIVWANPERQFDDTIMKSVKTLFLRNIDLSVNTREIMDFVAGYVPREEIKKISRVREFAFIDFHTRETAEKTLELITGENIKGHQIYVEWAMPPSENSIHFLKHNDYDAILRTKCIANYWSIPVIIYGRIYPPQNLQYVAIYTKRNSTVHAIFLEVTTIEFIDIHSRVSEVFIQLIDNIGYLPPFHYVVKVDKEHFQILGYIANLQTAKFIHISSDHVNNKDCLYWNEIIELCSAINTLTSYSEETIFDIYYKALAENIPYSYMANIFTNNRVFGCINSAFRNRPPLKYNLPNHQMILTLCDIFTRNNYNYQNSPPLLYSIAKCELAPGTHPILINLLPLRLAQIKNNLSCVEAIYFGNDMPATNNVQHISMNY